MSPYDVAYLAGFRQGYRDGLLQEVLARQIAVRFGPLPDDQLATLRDLSGSDLIALAMKAWPTGVV
jgi:hypothetical protein